MSLLSDNVYAMALRKPRVVMPPYSAHNFTRFKKIEAAQRQGAKDAGFAARTVEGRSMRQLFDPFVRNVLTTSTPEAGTGRIVRASA